MTAATIVRPKGAEFIVRLHVNGRYVPGADYITDDELDAIEAADAMTGKGPSHE